MEWTLIRDKLPEQGHDVLLFDGGQIYFGYYSEISQKFILGNDKVEVADFSHWMPLPPFPQK
jgi:hypothetical protein